MKKLLIIFLFLFILTGCTDKTLEKLDTPENLMFVDAIYFDAVSHATSYVLDINGEEIVITAVNYQITVEGDYTVRVKARAEGYEDSLYSEQITFTVDYTFEVPTSVAINAERVLTWDAMSDALKYFVFVNGERFETIDNSFPLSGFDDIPLVLQVKAVYALGESVASSRLIDEEGAHTVGMLKFNYSLNSTFDLNVLQSPNLIYIKESSNELEITSYQFTSQEIKLNTAYLHTLTIGEHTLTVLTYDGYYYIEINIIDTTKPYLISSNEVFTDFQTDLVFLFETFDGSITGVSGNDITSDDFSITRNIVTIDIDFVRNKFETDDERTTLILSYTLEQGNDIVIGYLFIKPLDLPTL